MNIWYLDHSGVAVDTETHLMIFDYYNPLPFRGHFEHGVVDTAQLPQDKPVVVFSSHSHSDHYNNTVLTWDKPNISFVFSSDITGDSRSNYISPHQTLDIAGLQVSTLKSTDMGVAFLVKTPTATIYHAGDLHWWHWNGEPKEFNTSMADAYKAEIERIKDTQIDLAFLPVDPRLEGAEYLGAQYFINLVHPKNVVPIHQWGKYGTGVDFAEKFATDTTAIHTYTARGELIKI